MEGVWGRSPSLKNMKNLLIQNQISETHYGFLEANEEQNTSLALGKEQVDSKCRKKGLLRSDSFQLEAWIIISAS